MEYHELNPLIRGRELELLSNETFERMIQTNSVEALGEILKSTIYSPYIYDESFKGAEPSISLVKGISTGA